MTAQQLATEIVNRRGGKEAFASFKQTQWMLDLINKAPEGEINWTMGNGVDEYYMKPTDGNGQIAVIVRHPGTTAKVVRFDCN